MFRLIEVLIQLQNNQNIHGLKQAHPLNDVEYYSAYFKV